MNRMRVTTTGLGLLLLLLTAETAQSQTLLSETTWGGAGSDVAEAVATSADGSSYTVGITDSFTFDQFGTPSPRIFVVKFAANAGGIGPEAASFRLRPTEAARSGERW